MGLGREENSDIPEEYGNIPYFDLRDVWRKGEPLGSSETIRGRADIFKRRKRNAEARIEELKEDISDEGRVDDLGDLVRELEKDKRKAENNWEDLLEEATDEQLRKAGANPVTETGSLDYQVGDCRIRVDSISTDSMDILAYSSASDLEPEEILEARNLAEKVEQELTDNRPVIEHPQAKHQAAEELRETVREDFHNEYRVKATLGRLYRKEVEEGLSSRELINKIIDLRNYKHSPSNFEHFLENDEALEDDEYLEVFIDEMIDISKEAGSEESTSQSQEHCGRSIRRDYEIDEPDFDPDSNDPIIEIRNNYDRIKDEVGYDPSDCEDRIAEAEDLIRSIRSYLEEVNFERYTFEGIPYENATEVMNTIVDRARP